MNIYSIRHQEKYANQLTQIHIHFFFYIYYVKISENIQEQVDEEQSWALSILNLDEKSNAQENNGGHGSKFHEVANCPKSKWSNRKSS